MYTKDQITVIDRLIAERIILCCLDQGNLIRVHNGEGWDGLMTAEFIDIVEKLYQAEVASLYVFASPLARQHVGWVLLVPEQAGWDVISDYSTAMEPLVKEAEKLADEFENGTRSPIVDRQYYVARNVYHGAGKKIPDKYQVMLGQHDVLFETTNGLEAAWHAHKLNTGEIVA